MTKVKEFFKRNVAVLLLIVVAIIAGTNYLIYPTFIKKDMNLVEIPIAKIDIAAGEKVTAEMLTVTLINPETLPEGVETNSENIIGKYVKEQYTVNQAMFFPKSSLESEKTKLGNVYYKLNEGEYALTLSFTESSGSITPNADDKFKTGQYIDIMYRENIIVAVEENTATVPSVATAEDMANKNVFTSSKWINGILDTNVRILSCTKDEKQTVITLAIKEEDLPYYLIADKTGELLPILSSFATQVEHDTTVYNQSLTRTYLDSIAQTIANEEVEETNQNGEETIVERVEVKQEDIKVEIN